MLVFRRELRPPGIYEKRSDHRHRDHCDSEPDRYRQTRYHPDVRAGHVSLMYVVDELDRSGQAVDAEQNQEEREYPTDDDHGWRA